MHLQNSTENQWKFSDYIRVVQKIKKKVKFYNYKYYDKSRKSENNYIHKILR
jgi:hypothetical protein